MSSTLSLTRRAALALVLMLGYYGLTLAIVGGVLYLPYAVWTSQEEIRSGTGSPIKFDDKIRSGTDSPIKFALGVIVSALIILEVALSTSDRFRPPGARLDLRKYPQLLETLTGIAYAVKQQMPSEVYLIPEMNAYVMHYGGIMGVGGRRIMGLGLPLLQLLTVSQLRAVLAHEFGHFHHGDTRLGPWVYKTEMAIHRTLQRLADYRVCYPLTTQVGESVRMYLWITRVVFLGYSKVFLSITRPMSRHQEFAADALAAQVVGARPLSEGLRLTHRMTLACDGYWTNEVLPILKRGFRPPITQGWHRYLAAARIAEMISTALTDELARGKARSNDTHPPLRERLAALQHQSKTVMPTQDQPAISLLEKNVEECEIRLINALMPGTTVRPMQSVTWEEVGQKVWIPVWEDCIRKHQGVLAGITTRTLPTVVQDHLAVYASQMKESGESNLTPAAMLGMALAVALYRHGWTLSTLPGEDVVCECQGTRLKPFAIILRLAVGEFTPAAWQECCATAGIVDLDIAGEVSPAPESPADPLDDRCVDPFEDAPCLSTTMCPACGHTWIGHWHEGLKERQCPECRKQWRVI